MPETPAPLHVEVCYAEPGRTIVCATQLPAGSRVCDALAAVRGDERLAGVDIAPERLGIYSRKVQMDTLLKDGDRVEIYRPLRMDPREARRRRASS